MHLITFDHYHRHHKLKIVSLTDDPFYDDDETGVCCGAPNRVRQGNGRLNLSMFGLHCTSFTTVQCS